MYKLYFNYNVVFFCFLYLFFYLSHGSIKTKNVLPGWKLDPIVVSHGNILHSHSSRSKRIAHSYRNRKCKIEESMEGHIIKTNMSLDAGARFIESLSISTAKECRERCCHDDECNTAVIRTRNYKSGGISCYLFDCKSPNVCSFDTHIDFDVVQLSPPSSSSPSSSSLSSSPSTSSSQERQLDELPRVTKPTVTRTECSTGFHEVAGSCRKDCQKLSFECVNVDRPTFNQCIALYDKCDTFKQCDDGSDEDNCPYDHQQDHHDNNNNNDDDDHDDGKGGDERKVNDENRVSTPPLTTKQFTTIITTTTSPTTMTTTSITSFYTHNAILQKPKTQHKTAYKNNDVGDDGDDNYNNKDIKYNKGIGRNSNYFENQNHRYSHADDDGEDDDKRNQVQYLNRKYKWNSPQEDSDSVHLSKLGKDWNSRRVLLESENRDERQNKLNKIKSKYVIENVGDNNNRDADEKSSSIIEREYERERNSPSPSTPSFAGHIGATNKEYRMHGIDVDVDQSRDRYHIERNDPIGRNKFGHHEYNYYEGGEGGGERVKGGGVDDMYVKELSAFKIKNYNNIHKDDDAFAGGDVEKSKTKLSTTNNNILLKTKLQQQQLPTKPSSSSSSSSSSSAQFKYGRHNINNNNEDDDGNKNNNNNNNNNNNDDGDANDHVNKHNTHSSSSSIFYDHPPPPPPQLQVDPPMSYLKKYYLDHYKRGEDNDVINDVMGASYNERFMIPADYLINDLKNNNNNYNNNINNNRYNKYYVDYDYDSRYKYDPIYRNLLLDRYRSYYGDDVGNNVKHNYNDLNYYNLLYRGRGD